MKALVDGDVLVYEVGFGCLTGWEGDGPPPFDRAADLLDNKIGNILATVGATEHQIYLTGKDNFRHNIATIKPYKGNRQQEKPFHYYNLRAYMQGKWNAIIVDGKEADDAMAIEQWKDYILAEGNPFYEPATIIASRDKDLKQVPGLHYSWELGNQPSFGPKFISEAEGMRFFYYQCLVGDVVDNIQGLPKCGPVKANKILSDTLDTLELFKAVREAYRGFYEDFEMADKMFLENAQLLWMVRELDEEGKPKMYEPPRVV